ncbi:hypothetical protein SAMN02799624_05234 [Paenibacillus sp. UNC496MF]|uniref:hypothetical protein n=1 Tax=Paenibacillus sp. UNC496MF TaxID=1502753 RepID=UPI0008E224EB|nr:hypothetical protein [Paenibacillus sp. UNC496MF]SFJ62641.1 hypothetical protein SAMN02799624_05234 [Paenibacillus sp. UNC496MF]
MIEEIVSDVTTRVVFHFNKKSIGNPGIAPWVVKCKGQTHYVMNVTSSVPFSTKNTPDSPHTQGSLQFRGCLKLVTTSEGIEAIIY